MEKHQIALVGGAILPIYYAIKKDAPDVVHLIVTPESKKSVGPLVKLVEPSIACRIHVVSSSNPLDIREKLMPILSGEHEYSLHLTGGNKLMALVAADLAKQQAIPAFYYAGGDQWIHIPDYTVEHSEIVLDNDEIIALSDHLVKSRIDYKLLDQCEFETARQVHDFRQKHASKYNKLRIAFEENANFSQQLKKQPVRIGSLTLSYDEEQNLLLKEGEQLLLKLNSSMSEDALLRAGWWELLVAQAIHGWAPDRAIWISAIFPSKKDEKMDKNEVDVLVNLGQNLLFVECKSGKVVQSDVYKMLAVRKTYGGDKSRSVLVSYHPVSSEILEKCREHQIEVLAPFNRSEGLELLKRLPEFVKRIIVRNNL